MKTPERVTDDEVRRIMVEGGKKLCDHAIKRWVSGEYTRRGDPGAEEFRQKMIAHWKEIKGRIGPHYFLNKKRTRR